ncbi:MAG: chemotaxis protein CheX [Gemmataceae bacterium]|nr:chemotaxis protein CheX [Gemmataceae bacterium]
MSTAVASPAFPPVLLAAAQDSTAAFFKTCCGLVAAPSEANGAAGAGIMSSISFLGDQPWAFALAFPPEAAVALAKSFAGFDIPFDSPDMGDLLGEIANVIAGDITARLAKKNIKAQMSLPTSVRGENVSLLLPATVVTQKVTFAGPEGTCWLHLLGTRTDGLSFRRPGGS